MCICVWDRERDSESEREREKERGTKMTFCKRSELLDEKCTIISFLLGAPPRPAYPLASASVNGL